MRVVRMDGGRRVLRYVTRLARDLKISWEG
jgi:hypothetical protein